jgi:hypothetical protein
MKGNQIIIFSNSYSPRTGHNFAAQVFKIFTNHEVLIQDKSETRLSTFLEVYYKLYNTHIFHQTDKDFFDYLFIDDLRQKILSKSNREFIVIKDTSFVGVSHLKKIFPDDLHIILIRDPRDVFLSLFKGMRLKKRTVKNFMKRLTTPIGIYPFFYALKVSRKIIKQVPELKDYIVIKYEDLVLQEEQTLLKLKNIFDCNKPIDVIKTEIDQIPVINTSFINETNAKHIWDAKPKTSSFQPVKRKSANRLVELGILLGSKKLRKKLNYL